MNKSALSFCFSGATAISFLLCLEGPSRALTVSSSQVFSPVLQIDGGSSSTQLNIAGLTSTVTNVLVTMNITKCGFLLPGSSIDAFGVCTVSGLSSNSQINLALTNPNGVTRRLVEAGDVTGQNPGETVSWSFQDSIYPPVGGNLLVGGSYSPRESFAPFVGGNGNGDWLLTYGDTVFDGRPLSLNSWSISVTDENGPTPADVPGPFPLFGVAAAFGWSRLLRKRIRARRDLRSGS
jgi:hypothetical protein